MGGDSARARRLEVSVAVPLGAVRLRLDLGTDAAAVAVFGPSGSGKSTLVRVLAGVERRAEGVVRVHGETWLDTARGWFLPAWHRRVGWVPQEVLLFPHLNVRANLAYGGADGEAVEEIAGLLRLEALLERRPRRLSGGEAQRVALGRALLARPRILLLDEPFSALDRALREEVAHTVRAWCRERDVPLVLVSHDEADARILAQERYELTLTSGLVRVA